MYVLTNVLLANSMENIEPEQPLMRNTFSEVAFLSSEIGFITTASTWSEAEILLLLYVAGNVSDIEKKYNENGYEILTYTLPRNLLSKLLGRRVSYKEAVGIFKKLKEREVCFRNENLSINGVYNIFNAVLWSDDLKKVYFEITPRAMSRFSDLKKYIPFALSHRKSLRHANPIRLYILIKKDIYYYAEYRRKKLYSIKELREIFGCQEKYLKTNDFIRKVIVHSINMINAKADAGDLDIRIHYEICKTIDIKGKRVNGVYFSASKESNYKDYILPEPLESIVTVSSSDNVDQHDVLDYEIKEYIKDLNISSRVISRYVIDYGVRFVSNAIRITKDESDQKTITKSATAYFIGVVKQKPEYDNKKRLNKILNAKIADLISFCTKEKDNISVLLYEHRIIRPYMINYEHRNLFNELHELLSIISNYADAIGCDLSKSREVILQCDGDVYIDELIKVSLSQINSNSLEESILNYENILNSDEWFDGSNNEDSIRHIETYLYSHRASLKEVL
jgi:hypothetical protein